MSCAVSMRPDVNNPFESFPRLDDLIEAYHHALSTTEISGAVNAVAPHPVTNLEFTGTLGKVRPATGSSSSRRAPLKIAA